jgi:hypothetical protein
MDINLQHHNLLGKQILPKSGGFLYFGGHFGFKMATIANQNVAIWWGGGWKKFKMVAVTMVTKVQKKLNRTADPFET